MEVPVADQKLVTRLMPLDVAIEDLAAAHFVYEAAKERGEGTWVDIGGPHVGRSAGE